MKTVFYILIFLFSFFLVGYGCSQSQNPDTLCEEFDKTHPIGESQYECCQESLQRIKQNSYKVLPSHWRWAFCPKGTEKNMLRCMGTLSWCEPKTVSGPASEK